MKMFCYVVKVLRKDLCGRTCAEVASRRFLWFTLSGAGLRLHLCII